MSKISENPERIGRGTSSEIYKLFGTKAVRQNYIDEKKLEIQLGRSLDTSANSRDICWGFIIEKWVGNTKGTDYIEMGDKTLVHPNNKLFWSGSPDLTAPRLKRVTEVKGYQPKKFAAYTNALLAAKLDRNPNVYERNKELREDFPKEYWQSISNSVLTGFQNVEMICAMPQFSDLIAIADIAANWEDDLGQYQYKSIYDDIINERYHAISFLPDGGYYDAQNSYVFEAPAEDVKALTAAVALMSAELIQFKATILKAA